MSKPYIRVAAGVILNKDHQVLLAQRPEGGQVDGGEYHDQPGGEENDPPVFGRFKVHLAVGKKAVVIAGMALIEQLAEAVFNVPQILVNLVLAPVVKDQRQGHRQPFPERWVGNPG